MSRRGGYLLTWGIVYVALGSLFTHNQLPVIWQWHFVVAGAIAIAAAFSSWKWLDTAGFVLLAMSSAAMGVRFMFLLLDSVTTLNSLGTVIWMGVAVAQVIVSGWPDTIKITYEDSDSRESNGGSN